VGKLNVNYGGGCDGEKRENRRWGEGGRDTDNTKSGAGGRGKRVGGVQQKGKYALGNSRDQTLREEGKRREENRGKNSRMTEKAMYVKSGSNRAKRRIKRGGGKREIQRFKK